MSMNLDLPPEALVSGVGTIVEGDPMWPLCCNRSSAVKIKAYNIPSMPHPIYISVWGLAKSSKL